MVYAILNEVMNRGDLENYSYEDLLEDCIQRSEDFKIAEFSEQVLLSCGKFIIGQIFTFEENADEDELTVLDSIALAKLRKLSNAGKRANKDYKRGERLEARKKRRKISDEDDDDDFDSYDSEDSYSRRRRKKFRRLVLKH